MDRLGDGSARRERRRASATLNNALDALNESKRHARRGDLRAAAHLARLAERHAQTAERLIDLKTALRRISTARLEAERQLNAMFAAREAALKQREAEIGYFEASLPPQAERDVEAAQWRERFAKLRAQKQD